MQTGDTSGAVRGGPGIYETTRGSMRPLHESGSYAFSSHDPDKGAEVAVLDLDGVIVEVNQAWLGFGAANGADVTKTGVGTSYLEACISAGGDPQADQIAAALRTALAGNMEAPTKYTASCHSPERLRWFETTVRSRLDDDGRCNGAVVSLRLTTSTKRLGALPTDSVVGHGVQRPDGCGDGLGVGVLGIDPAGVTGSGVEGYVESRLHTGPCEPLGDGVSRALLDLVGDGVLIVDELGEIVEANARAEQLLGFEPGGLTSVPFRSVLPRGLAQEAVVRDTSISRDGTVGHARLRLAARGLRRDGSEVSVIVRHSSIPLTSGTGTLIVLSGVRALSPDGTETRGALPSSPVGSFLDDLLPVIGRVFQCGSTLTGAVDLFDMEPPLAAKIRSAVDELDQAISDLRMIASATQAVPSRP